MPSCDPVLPYIHPFWTGIEIGVAEGHSSHCMLEFGVKFLYLVDPWEGEEGRGRYAQMFVTLSRYPRQGGEDWGIPPRFQIVRKTSADAASMFETESVDFIFVDGDHRYEWVKSDLELYWPKVKKGGIFCGHDYTNCETCQVGRAVDEFAAKNGLTVERALDCWIIRKNI